MIKKILKGIVSNYLKNKYKHVATFGNDVFLSRHVKIISDTEKSIVVGDNCILLCNIISENGGKIIIGNNTSIRYNVNIRCAESITIGNNVIFAQDITVADNNNHPVNPDDRKFMINSGWQSKFWKWKYSVSKPVVIGDNVWIAQNVFIMKGVTIGNNSIIAAGSVVTKSVPENCIAAGNPARIVKENLNDIERIF